jgi:hypothetical protein
VLEEAGFGEVAVQTLDEPLELGSAADALQMMKDAFGVYRAIVGDQPAEVQEAAWAEVQAFLRRFETPEGFRIPAQVHVAGAVSPGA